MGRQMRGCMRTCLHCRQAAELAVALKTCWGRPSLTPNRTHHQCSSASASGGHTSGLQSECAGGLQEELVAGRLNIPPNRLIQSSAQEAFSAGQLNHWKHSPYPRCCRISEMGIAVS